MNNKDWHIRFNYKVLARLGMVETTKYHFSIASGFGWWHPLVGGYGFGHGMTIDLTLASRRKID